jgi:hypothetical protein
MKFLFHITITDNNHARMTFSVLEVGRNIFQACPVENKLSSNNLSFPTITFWKQQSYWEYQFENNEHWLGEPYLEQMFLKLCDKLAKLEVVDSSAIDTIPLSPFSVPKDLKH